MSARVNTPFPQIAPLSWTVFVAFGVVVAVSRILQFPVGTSGWQAGWALVGLGAVAFILPVGLWCYTQREFAFDGRTLTIRRWLEILFERPGMAVPLDGTLAVALVVNQGRYVVLTRRSVLVARVFVGLWPMKNLEALIEAFGEQGLTVGREPE